MEQIWLEIGLFFVTTSFGIIGWLLSRQIDSIKEAIQLLFKKHDADKDALDEFKLHVAGKHYEAHTVDEKFDKIENSVKDGFRDVGNKLDRLSGMMLNHITDDKTGKFNLHNGEQ